MNIGDGLLFELENGKPRLIVLNGGAEKNPEKRSFRPRPAKVLSSRQPSCAEEVQRPARQQVGRSKAEGGVSSAHSSVLSTHTEGRKTRRHGQRRQDCVRLGAKGRSNKGCAAVHQEDGGTKENSGDAGLRDKAAALTADQLIRSSLQTCCGDKEGDQAGPKSRGSPNEGGEERMEKVKEPAVDCQGNVSRASGCAFSWLEERLPHGEAASGAKEAQWRRDVGEPLEPKHSAPVRLQVESTHVTSKKSQSESSGLYVCVTQEEGGSTGWTEQHAAIRSSLRLGDVSPLDTELNTKKKEEQRRRWLQELDRQRQEATERRRREKLLQNQVEDQECWMAHFDSLQRRAPTRAGVPSAPPEGRLWEPSSSLSLAWEASSTGGGDSLVGASVDSSSRCQTRSSYLRTMTSLLDPSQIEERERRRLKQLEQQRAIEAQMEERRKLRAEEEAKRRREEEREERRLDQEREALQRQYELETRKEKQTDGGGGLQTDGGGLQSDGGGLQTDGGGGLQTPEGSRKEAGLQDAGVLSLRDTAVQTDAADGVQTLDVAVQYHPPLPRRATPPNSRRWRAGKENIREAAGGDQYEARAERRRPEWNTQRPSRRFVPASQRYPPDLQRSRQRSRQKRQEELLALQVRVRPLKPDLHPRPQLSRTCAPPCRKVESRKGGGGGAAHQSDSRGQQLVPYVRSDEVRLDPLEPADTNTGAPVQSPAPLSHTRRQQLILSSLARLRQGLLQKQRELEMDLNPPHAQHHDPSPRTAP